jgi:hypothetical protein
MPKNFKEALVAVGALVVVSFGLVALIQYTGAMSSSELGLISAAVPKKVVPKTVKKAATSTPRTFDETLIAAGLKTETRGKVIPACTNGNLLTGGLTAKTFTYTGNAVQGIVNAVQSIAAANGWSLCYSSPSAITYIKGGRLLGLTWSDTGTKFARVQYEY